MQFIAVPCFFRKNIVLNYIKSEFSFVSFDIDGVFYFSVLINDVNLFFGENKVAFSIAGISSFLKWEKGDVKVPASFVGELHCIGDIVPGASYRINDFSDYWPVLFDENSGWIEIKKTNLLDIAVEIFDGVVVGLYLNRLVAIWLRPNFTE